MKPGALIAYAVGSLFSGRVHLFVMPAVATWFVSQALNRPLPFECGLMICLTMAGGYVYNRETDTAEDAIDIWCPNRVFGKHRTC